MHLWSVSGFVCAATNSIDSVDTRGGEFFLLVCLTMLVGTLSVSLH